MVATQDKSAPLVAIIGATGNQGGSVFDHLAASDKPYRLRAITRDPTKPNAEELRKKGGEVVAGDLDDKASIEKAFAGADIVFGVTQFWAHGSIQREVADGKLLIDAAKAAGVKTFVWSGLENVTKASGGKITKVEHFDGKGQVTEYGRQSGIGFINVQPGTYMENLLTMQAPRKQPDGSFAWAAAVKPDTVWSWINCRRDYGAYVREALESPNFGPGSEVLASSEELTSLQVAEILSKGLGKKVNFVPLPDQAVLDNFPAPMNEDFLAMLHWFRDFGYYGAKSIKASNADIATNAKPQTFEDFAATADWSKVLEG